MRAWSCPPRQLPAGVDILSEKLDENGIVCFAGRSFSSDVKPRRNKNFRHGSFKAPGVFACPIHGNFACTSGAEARFFASVNVAAEAATHKDYGRIGL
jgi:hypothetical protein